MDRSVRGLWPLWHVVVRMVKFAGVVRRGGASVDQSCAQKNIFPRNLPDGLVSDRNPAEQPLRQELYTLLHQLGAGGRGLLCGPLRGDLAGRFQSFVQARLE